MSSVLEISGLRKSFGNHRVIQDLDLRVSQGSVFGFIGPNGSGKTTTMKMVLGLLRPDSGTIRVCGEKVSYGETKTNRYIGYLPDVPEFYGYMTPQEYLGLCGRITGMKKTMIDQKSTELLVLVGLDTGTRKIAGFSRGMKQRLGIAQALLNEPRLLICDEPTSALDPLGRREILEILSRVRGRTTVLFSTHVLSDVERICDQIAVLNKGKIVLSGTLNNVKARHAHNEYLIEFHETTQLERFREALSFDYTNKRIISEDQRLRITTQTGQELVDLLASLHITPLRFELVEPALEDLFIEVIE